MGRNRELTVFFEHIAGKLNLWPVVGKEQGGPLRASAQSLGMDLTSESRHSTRSPRDFAQFHVGALDLH